MKKGIGGLADTLFEAVQRKSPEILTGIGIGSSVLALIFGIKNTPKALKAIEEKKKELEVDKLPVKETIKTAGKYYIPTVTLEIVSAACILGSKKVTNTRVAALSAAYSLSESTLKEYQDKVVEAIGERKEQKIRDDISSDHVKNNPPVEQQIVLTENGNALCHDRIANRYFRSDINHIKQTINDLNYKLNQEMYISWNEYLYEMGLPRMLDIGDELGWSSEYGQIDIHYSSELTDKGEPCLVLDYHIQPRWSYRD